MITPILKIETERSMNLNQIRELLRTRSEFESEHIGFQAYILLTIMQPGDLIKSVQFLRVWYCHTKQEIGLRSTRVPEVVPKLMLEQIRMSLLFHFQSQFPSLEDERLNLMVSKALLVSFNKPGFLASLLVAQMVQARYKAWSLLLGCPKFGSVSHK